MSDRPPLNVQVKPFSSTRTTVIIRLVLKDKVDVRICLVQPSYFVSHDLQGQCSPLISFLIRLGLSKEKGEQATTFEFYGRGPCASKGVLQRSAVGLAVSEMNRHRSFQRSYSIIPGY